MDLETSRQEALVKEVQALEGQRTPTTEPKTTKSLPREQEPLEKLAKQQIVPAVPKLTPRTPSIPATNDKRKSGKKISKNAQTLTEDEEDITDDNVSKIFDGEETEKERERHARMNERKKGDKGVSSISISEDHQPMDNGQYQDDKGFKRKTDPRCNNETGNTKPQENSLPDRERGREYTHVNSGRSREPYPNNKNRGHSSRERTDHRDSSTSDQSNNKNSNYNRDTTHRRESIDNSSRDIKRDNTQKIMKARGKEIRNTNIKKGHDLLKAKG